MQETEYALRADIERKRFGADTDVHALPPIFHYWTNRHLLPALRELGFDSFRDVFESTLLTQCQWGPDRTRRFISLGAGNCDFEIGLAQYLNSEGFENFQIECLDLNDEMLTRGRAAAREGGVENLVIPVAGDFNTWKPAQEYDAVLANQSLHHVVELEYLFDSVWDSLALDGCFVISDIIGRNGHMRWPESMKITQEFWRELPPSYRFNQSLKRYEETFNDWDCSCDAFEGIRSQDILPLLIGRFSFRFFFGFANLIDPFVDRTFGRYFDPEAEWDRDFIDRVHARDEAELAAGNLKPTHMLAVLGRHAQLGTVARPHLTPERCVRNPDAVVAVKQAEEGPYAWNPAVHDPLRETAILGEQLLATQEERDHNYEEFVQRTLWGQQLDAELKKRTEWAMKLDAEVLAGRAEITRLNELLRVRSEELCARTAELDHMKSEVRLMVRNPLRYLWVLFGAFRNLFNR